MKETNLVALDRTRALFLIVDAQERLAAAMPPAAMQAVAGATARLAKGAGVLGVPVMVTEQYPKGLGRTIEGVSQALPPESRRFEKTAFSCWQSPQVREAIESSGRNQVVVCGMETHVCVYQTVRDLASAGIDVLVVTDAVLSRTEENRAIGLGLMTAAGALATSVEAVLFDLLGAAGTAEFKAISMLVK